MQAGAPPNPEDEIIAATPPALVRAAGGVILFAGALSVLTGGQTLLVAVVHGIFGALPYLLIGLGAVNGFLGLMVFRARDWAALGATVLSALLLLLTSLWLVVSFGGGLFQLYALGAPFAAAGALAMAIASLGPCRRATVARDRLSQQGLSLGI